MSTISVVILDYRKSHRVLENVASLQQQQLPPGTKLEIIVVDNSADPATKAKLAPLAGQPGIQLIFNEKNLGYPGGCNAGARFATGEFVLILNPDIVWTDSTALATMLRFLQKNPQVGVVGPQQFNDSDGELARTARAFPNLFIQIARRTWLRRLPVVCEFVARDELRHVDLTRPRAVDWLQSSCILIRRELWDRLGGFSESYFIFMADPDLCFRAWQVGAEVVYLPAATVHADGLRASAGGFWDFFRRWTIRQHFADSLRYQLRFLGQRNPREKLAQEKKIGEYVLG